MSWISGPCNDEPGEPEEVSEPERSVDEIDEQPRFVWGMSTNFAGITDRINPGHFLWMSERESE